MEENINTPPKKTAPLYAPQNEQEAWIAIMNAFIAVDGNVADEELDVLSDTLAKNPLFQGHDVLAYSRKVFYKQAQLGSKQMIDNSVEWIAPEHKPRLFAHTIQLALSDGVVIDKEAELVKYLYSALDLDRKSVV